MRQLDLFKKIKESGEEPDQYLVGLMAGACGQRAKSDDADYLRGYNSASSEKKSKQISIRLTQTQFDNLDDLARDNNTSKTEYIQSLLDG